MAAAADMVGYDRGDAITDADVRHGDVKRRPRDVNTVSNNRSHTTQRLEVVASVSPTRSHTPVPSTGAQRTAAAAPPSSIDDEGSNDDDDSNDPHPHLKGGRQGGDEGGGGYDHLSYRELQAASKALNLKVTGPRAELVARLDHHRRHHNHHHKHHAVGATSKQVDAKDKVEAKAQVEAAANKATAATAHHPAARSSCTVEASGADDTDTTVNAVAAAEAKTNADADDYDDDGGGDGGGDGGSDVVRRLDGFRDSFYFTNISPQVGLGFNRGYWARVERFVRGLPGHVAWEQQQQQQQQQHHHHQDTQGATLGGGDGVDGDDGILRGQSDGPEPEPRPGKGGGSRFVSNQKKGQPVSSSSASKSNFSAPDVLVCTGPLFLPKMVAAAPQPLAPPRSPSSSMPAKS